MSSISGYGTGGKRYGSGTYGLLGVVPPRRYRARYRIEVAWQNVVEGVFQLDRSRLDGPDLIATNSWSQTFTGPFDDITADVNGFAIIRGRSDDLSTVDAGKLTVALRDPNGKYSASNPSSPLAGLLKPNRPIRVSAVYGTTTYPLYYGFLQTGDAKPGQRQGESTLEASDLFSWLGNPPDRSDTGVNLPTITRVEPTTTGAAIGLILDALLWTDASTRLLDVGDPIPFFKADGTATPLSLISALLDANRGLFFIDAAGRAVYEHRNTRVFRAPYAAVTNVMDEIMPGFSADRIVNQWKVTRQNEDGTDAAVKTRLDSASSRENGVRTQELASAYMMDDTFADGLAAWLLGKTAQPTSPIWGLTLDNRDDYLFQTILQAELNRKITVQDAKFGTDADYYIEQLSHTVDQQKIHTCQMVLSLVPPEDESIMVIDQGQLDVNTLGF